MASGFLDGPRPRAFAHRGGGAEAEENTLAAFARAVSLGFRYIETDVQPSADGVAIVCHDPTLDAAAGRPERIDALPWSALAGIATRGGGRLSRLDDILDAFPDTRFNIEPKSDAVAAPLAEAIRRTGAWGRVCIGCFDGRRTQAVLRRLGRPVAWSPGRAGVARLWLASLGLPVPGLAFPAVQIPTSAHGVSLATPRMLAAAHARGIEMHVWTIDEPAEMARLLDLGVDGLMTGRPSVLRAVMQARGLWPA